MSKIIECDVVLVGAGIMSATLATLLHELDSSLSIHIYEKLDRVAAESSDVGNNAGTGHSAFCELNYTPERANGDIDITKAIAVAESCEVSKQFRARMVEKGAIKDPRAFINRIPHCSIVFGEKNVQFLKTRYQNMSRYPLFTGMEYSEAHARISEWMQLIMKNRDPDQPLAATFMDIGTDINFAALTRGLIEHITATSHVHLHLNHHVSDLQKQTNGQRNVLVEDRANGQKTEVHAKFVFIGAGGAALTLLQKSGITERKGLGGFPVSGQRLMCNNPDIIAQHDAKVYGKASLGAPPMSVPHLDTRIIDGKKALLFGPYAGFTTKFLKHGSFFDLLKSLQWHNIIAMLGAGLHNFALTKYLISQVIQRPEDRLTALREYVVDARMEDRDLKEAGYCVQIIKPDPKQGGTLQFGTEVIISQDGTLATLLGASPGASTSVDIMLHVIETCFPSYLQDEQKIKELIPSYGKKLNDDEKLLNEVRTRTHQVLGI